MFYMNELAVKKYIDAGVDGADLLYWEVLEHNRYGFVYVKNPHYLIDDDDMEYLIRKPTPKERREIVINTVIECNGRTFAVCDLADRLGVSERTMQIILRQLQKERLIEIIPRHNKNGKQTRNAYRYIGPQCKLYGSGLTLRHLYSTKQDVGFRYWAWKEYEFKHNKVWHNIYALCKAKFDARVARRKYLERNNLPLVIPEDVKYLVLRYCYWKGEYRKLYDNNLFSKDGSLKLELFPLGRTETVDIFGYTFSVEFGGTKENPQITISDKDTGEQMGVFGWFNENVIENEKDIDETQVEQYFIVGDFTTK